ncbi:MAG: hypothetical protein HKN76_04110 [Saprospiraceae bacterium]|nr:hypothetical protein [Saprospiraceae bacterium]
MDHPFQRIPRYSLPVREASEMIGQQDARIWVILGKQEVGDPALMELLRKILKAIEIDLDQDTFQILSGSGNSFYLSDMLPSSSNDPKIIFSFGVSPQDLGMEIKLTHNRPFKLIGHRFLFSHSLKDINSDSEKKRELWKAIQPMKVKL